MYIQKVIRYCLVFFEILIKSKSVEGYMQNLTLTKNDFIKRFNDLKNDFQAYNYFSAISKCFMNLENLSFDTLDWDQSNYKEFYTANNFIEIDPMIDFLKHTNRELILFEELEFKEIFSPSGKIMKPGKVINQSRANGQYAMYNGFYTVARNKEKLIVSMYGLDSRQYDINNLFDPRKEDGKWFLNYQNSCEELYKEIFNYYNI